MSDRLDHLYFGLESSLLASEPGYNDQPSVVLLTEDDVADEDILPLTVQLEGYVQNVSRDSARNSNMIKNGIFQPADERVRPVWVLRPQDRLPPSSPGGLIYLLGDDGSTKDFLTEEGYAGRIATTPEELKEVLTGEASIATPPQVD